MAMREWKCPECGGGEAVRAGSTKLGKQRYQCTSCGRRVVDHPAGIDAITRAIVDRMIEEGCKPPMIARITNTSTRWVYKRRSELQGDR